MRYISAASTVPAPVTSWTDEENHLREMVSRFAKKHVAPYVSEMDANGQLRTGLLDELFKAGMMGIEADARYGGSELSFTAACIAVDEMAKVDPAVAVVVDIHNTLVVTALRKWANAAQIDNYMPFLCSHYLGAFCLSEEQAGSDAFALRTTAVRSDDGSHFTLNGVKMWISNALEASLFIIFANANPELGYKGITAFIVDKEEAKDALLIGKKENKLGIRASSCCEVVLNDLRVPAENVLGNVGEGYKIAMESLNEGRVGIGAQMIGLAQGALDATIPYCWQRKQFGRPVAENQGLAFQFAEASVELEAARLLVYNAARRNDSGLPFIKEAAYAKYYAAVVANKIAARCVEWVGGVGYTKDFPQEKFYRDAVIGKIYEGTHNIHLNMIAKLLQKEYRP